MIFKKSNNKLLIIVISKPGQDISSYLGAFLLRVILNNKKKGSVLLFDFMLNLDYSKISPYYIGENYVLKDGSFADFRAGIYERITGISLCKENVESLGSILYDILNKEYKGYYLGSYIDFNYTFIQEFEEKISRLLEKYDILVLDIKMSNFIYYSLLRNTLNAIKKKYSIFVIYPTYVKDFDQLSLESIEHEYRLINSYLKPDTYIVLSKYSIPERVKNKIRELMDRKILIFEDVNERPYNLLEVIENLIGVINESRNIKLRFILDQLWHNCFKVMEDSPLLDIAIITKYPFSKADLSLEEGLMISAYKYGYGVNTFHLDAESIEKMPYEEVERILNKFDGVVMGHGFGEAGVRGMIKSIKICREDKIPFLGVGYGFELAVIEFLKNVIGIGDASSEEWSFRSRSKVFKVIPGKEKLEGFGAGLRRGEYKVHILKDTILHRIYNKTVINERFKHRYMFDENFLNFVKRGGGVMSAYSFEDDNKIWCAFELPRNMHPFFVAVLYSPEYNTNFYNGHPLLDAFIKEIVKKNR